MVTKEELRRLVDELPDPLPDDTGAEAKRVLEHLRDLTSDDPFLRALANAPLDDEPLTPEDEAALAEAYEDIAQGRIVPWEEVKRSLKLDVDTVDIKKLQGRANDWRLRVGSVRVLFTFVSEGHRILVTRILPRSIAYR